MNLPKSLIFLGNFCKGFKIYHFSSDFFCIFFVSDEGTKRGKQTILYSLNIDII